MIIASLQKPTVLMELIKEVGVASEDSGSHHIIISLVKKARL